MSNKLVNLIEAASLASDAPAEDGTWKVRIISEGKGSSGVYPKELLEKHHHAFDDLLSFKNHPTGWDGPETRDFTMIAGQIVGETWVDSDERGLTAVYGNYLPDPEYADKLDRYKEKLGLSIFIEGSGFWEENAEGGEDFVIDWFNPNDPFASVDIVHAPGARGKFMESMRKNYESARAGSEIPTVRAAEEGLLEVHMEKKLDELIGLVSSLVAEKDAKAQESLQVEADTAAVKTAVEAFKVAVRAVDEAELLDSQKDAILEAVEAGQDVAPLIEAAVKVRDEAKQVFVESVEGQGRVVSESEGVRFGAWGK